MQGQRLRIGEVAGRAGVNIQTLRYYERRGLLKAPMRTASGYREYPSETVRLIRFIKRAQDLGFTLKEIKGLLALRMDASATKAEVRRQAQVKVADIESRIADLQRMRDVLQKLVRRCHGDGTARGCPILAALQGEDNDDPEGRP